MIYRTMTAAALAVVLASPAFAQSGATSPKGETPPKMQESTAPKADKDMTTGQSSSSSGTMQKDQNAQSGQSSGSTNQSSGSMTDKAGSDTAAQDKTSQDKPSMAASSAGEKQPGFLQTESSEQWRASKLMGASVVGPDDQSIGDINEILLSKDGGVEAVVVGVGGFLGMGEKNVAIAFESLNVQRSEGNEIEKISVSFSKEQLENAPKFAYAEEQARASTTGTRPGGSPMGGRPGPSSTQPR